MKKNKTKNKLKQIICIIITLMLCNFIIPNCAFAVDTAKGGSLMEAMTQFLCFIPDSIIGFLQDMFITPENIKTEDGNYSIKYSPGIIFSGEIPAFDIDFITPGEAKTVNGTKTYKSTAAILQRVISTWYNALKRIALVGLLSVIVYIGIKIVLSSTSAKDRAKYKAMLKDWVIALCLLFVLHYIMSITITVVDKINDVVKASSIAANGEDILLTSIRNKILNSSGWSTALTYVVIYSVLSVLTIIYTIQYVRRVIYIGFLTAIAPLITLTYPLDKIKDGKAQAFDMWVKDYIFFSLIQVVHLLVYYIFLGNSMDLADSGNWLFALVAIGFITQAEKLIKKMFGFEKSKTLGAMSAGITGALIMNAIQKVSQSASKKETSKKEESAVQEVKKPVRTAGVNQFVNYNETNTQSSSEKPSRYTKEKETKFGKMLKDKNLISDEKVAKVKTNIRGAKAVVKKYSAPIAIGTLRLAAKTTGGLLGFSVAVANGEDISGLVNKTVLGAASADGLANVASKGAVRLTKIPEKVDEVVDTYREEVYGKEVAQNAKFDRVFRRSKDYEVLRDESGFSNREFDQKLQKILDAGIDDPRRIKKILKNHKFNPQRYTMDKAIRFSKLADQCSKDILYDKVKFIRFCQDRKLGLSEEDLITLRKDMMNFK